MNEKNKTKHKLLNSFDLLMVSFGAMIGWGWVISSGEWINNAGVIGTVLGFILGGAMIYFIGLVYAELSASIPKGGCLEFSKKAFGKTGSFICTWMMILGYVGVVCFEACSLPTIVSYLFPNFLQGYLYSIGGFDIYATWLVTAIAFAILIVAVNIFGIKSAAIFQNILTVIIAVVGILLIVSSAIKGNVDNINGQLFQGENFFLNTKGIFSVAVVAPFFLFGFDVIPEALSEINVDLKKVGKILLISIICAVSFYALVVLAIGYGMGPDDIQNSINNSGLTAADAMALLFKSDIMAKVLVFGGLCGVITSWNSFMIGGSRTIASLAREGMISKVFNNTNKKFHTPHWSILLVGGASLIAPFFGRNMLNWIANAASFGCCIAYFIIALSFFKIHKQYPHIERPYKIKHWKIVGCIAILLSGFLVSIYILPAFGSSLSYEELIICVIWFALGLILQIFNRNNGTVNQYY